MRSFTKLEEANISYLTNLSIEFANIEVTKTGLNKSIMDATANVRMYLKSENFHDYSLQRQGDKVIKDAKILTKNKEIETQVSLYRPKTKEGDPRIWVYGLKEFMESNNILSVIVFNDILHVFNLSEVNIEQIVHESNTSFSVFLNNVSEDENKTSDELLEKLIEIYKLGPIATLVQSDTGVGRTLEKYLGIEMNSDKNPDYKGIELKAFRERKNVRKNLFAQVPNWKMSKFKSNKEILYQFGYKRDETLKLYCTVSCLNRNSQGLKLKLDDEKELLFENSEDNTIGNFLVWKLDTLYNRLLSKHKETFWIETESTLIKGKEHFLYKNILHTKKPSVTQLAPLLDQGDITIDHLISEKNGRVVEKGPLFKIKKQAIPMLIPSPKIYDLSKLAKAE